MTDLERDYSVQAFEKQKSQIASTFVTVTLGAGAILSYHLPNSNALSVTEALRQLKMSTKGRIKRAELNITGNTADQPITITVRKNSAPTNIVMIVPATSSVDLEDNDLVEFVENDLFAIEVAGAIGTGVLNYVLTLLLELDT